MSTASSHEGEIIAAALALPQSVRASLASDLLRSLAPEKDSEQETQGEAIQISPELCQEVMKRSDELHQGKSDLVSGAELVKELTEIVLAANQKNDGETSKS